MKSLFIYILLFNISLNLYAHDLKSDLMRIHANLIPKIMMMDYDFKKSLVNDAVSIAVVYENIQQKSDAQEIKRYIKVKYPDGFNKHKINIEYISYDNIQNASKHSFYYMLPSSEKNIRDALKITNRQKALSFAYDNRDLQYGVMLSVKITNKVKPMVNINALKATDIAVRPILLKVAEIYFQQSLIMIRIKDKLSLYIV